MSKRLRHSSTAPLRTPGAAQLFQPRRTVYHIGHHKTGTTAVQNQLRNSFGPANKAKQGILYPKVGHPKNGSVVSSNHNALHYLYLRAEHPFVTESSARELTTAIVGSVTDLEPDTVVFSAEDAFFLADRAAPYSELTYLDAIIPYPKEFVAFLRRPDQYASSWQKQTLWFGAKTRPLHTKQRVERLLDTCILNYRKALTPFLDHGDVAVLRYEHGANSVDMFYNDVLGIKAPRAVASANPSIPDVFAELARRFTVNRRRLSADEIGTLIRFGHRERVDMFGMANRQRLRDEFLATNDWLIDTFGAAASFDDVDAICDVPADWLSVDEAVDKYRSTFYELLEMEVPAHLQGDEKYSA